MINVLDFSDYKSYLRAIEKERGTFQRGFRSRLSEALECQNAYISQILNTHANFSLEQTLKIASFLHLNDMQTRYFILLVEYERAGTITLKEYFKKDIDSLREKHLNIIERVSSSLSLSLEQQTIYYSSWLYPTVHILVTVPEYRTISKIALSLNIDENLIQDVVLFLVSSGLVVETKGHLFPGPTQIHLAKQAANIRQHHTNWRFRAVQSLIENKKNDVHYSTVSSLSYEDAEKLKAKFVQLIQEYVETIGPSKEETLYNFNLDFYSLIKK